MSESVIIPSSIDDAVEALEGLGGLIYARKWERAAIVAAFVRLDHGHGGRDETRSSERFESARQFAERGIVGLSSGNSVTRYVQGWLDANDGKYPRPGATRRLPNGPFPIEDRARGSRVSNDPDRAVAQVIDKHGVDAVVTAATRHDRFAAQAAVSRTRAEIVGDTLPPPLFPEPPEIYPGSAEDGQRMDVEADVARVHNNISLLGRWLHVDRALLERHADRLDEEAERLRMIASAARGVDDAALELLLDGAE